jgi:hypothetical protein
LCRAKPALRAEATVQAPHDARAGLAQTLLNGSCLGPVCQTRPIWPSIPPHDNDGPRLSCYHLICYSTSFLSPSCLHLRAPILDRGRRSMRLLLVFVRHQPRYRLTQWLLHVNEDVSHHVRTIIFAVVGRHVRLPGLRLVLPPQPAALAYGRSREPFDAHRCGYEASWSCSWPFSVHAVEKDMVAPVSLRLSWR